MLNVPKTNYSDYYEQARFRLTWNIVISLVLALFVLCGMFLLFEPRFFVHYAGGFAVTLLGAFYLYIKRDYRLVAIIIPIVGFSLACSSIFFIPRAVHYIEPFWLIIITLYVYFSLGKFWGRYYLAGTIIVVTNYFIFALNRNITAFEEYSLGQTVTMSVEFIICGLILGYIIQQFILTNSHAEEKYRSANKELLFEKRNVETQNLEVTALLQEIHHRVKNNLQVITSLLRIQSANIVSEEAKENFQDAINRIMTMSLIHQKMYERENLAEIDLRDYFDSLVIDLVASNSPDIEIDLDVKIEVEKVGAKSIVPLALIITELITNSIKHAFEAKKRGMIGLKITPSDTKDHFLMEYFDNGTWKKEARQDSFGIQLVDTFTEQLEGNYKLILDEGKSLYLFDLKRIDKL